MMRKFAKFRRNFANFRMRNFAKCEISQNAKCEMRNFAICEMRNAKFRILRNAKCEISQNAKCEMRKRNFGKCEKFSIFLEMQNYAYFAMKHFLQIIFLDFSYVTIAVEYFNFLQNRDYTRRMVLK